MLFKVLVWCCLLLAHHSVASGRAEVVLADTDKFVAQRQGRYITIELRRPHRLLSTSRVNGGQNEGVRYLVNHQSMEPEKDNARFNKVLTMSSEQYHREVAEELGVSATEMVLLGTAASMNRIAHVTERYRALQVDAFVTAGVKNNATRAGDPARWYQGADGNQLAAYRGTINILLLINRPLTPAAQARAVSVVVEAKASVLSQLAVPSKISPHIATGTGTDQYAIAALIDDQVPSLESASTHVKLGELIGTAVRKALLEALRWQNGLEPSAAGSVLHALGRFGADESALVASLAKHLPAESHQLLMNNLHSLLTEPRVVAAAYGYAAVLDRIQYQTVPPDTAAEALRDQAAVVAAAVSMKPGNWGQYWRELGLDRKNTLQAFYRALALGWQDKWATDEAP